MWRRIGGLPTLLQVNHGLRDVVLVNGLLQLQQFVCQSLVVFIGCEWVCKWLGQLGSGSICAQKLLEIDLLRKPCGIEKVLSLRVLLRAQRSAELSTDHDLGAGRPSTPSFAQLRDRLVHGGNVLRGRDDIAVGLFRVAEILRVFAEDVDQTVVSGIGGATGGLEILRKLVRAESDLPD